MIKKIIRGITNLGNEVFEEIIEKPGKDIIEEVTHTITGTDKYDYRQPSNQK